MRHRIRTQRFERTGAERSVEVWWRESDFGIHARRHRSDSAPASNRPPIILVNQVPSRRRYCEVRLDRAQPASSNGSKRAALYDIVSVRCILIPLIILLAFHR